MPRGVDQMALEARAHGYWTHGPAPYGYRVIGTYPRRRLEPNEDAAVVRRIFQLVAFGAGLDAIAQGLTKEAARPPGRRPWDPVLLREVARNPTYAGLLRTRSGFVAAAFPGLVEEALFEAANVRLRIRTAGKMDRRALQRASFEDGYWHHARAPRGTRLIGQWPRYSLAPNEGLDAHRCAVELLADGAPWRDVLLPAAALFAAERATWRIPDEAVRLSLLRHSLHPALAGHTVWNHRKANEETRPARWTPLIAPQVFDRARLRMGLAPLGESA